MIAVALGLRIPYCCRCINKVQELPCPSIEPTPEKVSSDIVLKSFHWLENLDKHGLGTPLYLP